MKFASLFIDMNFIGQAEAQSSQSWNVRSHPGEISCAV